MNLVTRTINFEESFSTRHKLCDLGYNLSPGLIVFIFNLFIFNRYFPLSEGWWEAYGYFINNGLHLFKDLDITFSPVFALISAKLLYITGNSFFIIRLLGVFLITFVTVLCQMLLRQFYSVKVSSLATLLAVFMFIFSPQFIAKDYHTYLHLVVILWLLVLTKTAPNKSRLYVNISWSVLGALGALIFFFKQNVGVLLIFSLIATQILLRLTIKEKIERFIVFTSAFVAAFYLLSYVVGFDFSLISGNDSKGSLFTVIFRFATEHYNRDMIIVAMTLAAIALYYRYLISVYLTREKYLKIFGYYCGVRDQLSGLVTKEFVIASPFLVASMIVCYSPLRNFSMTFILAVSLSVLFICYYRQCTYYLTKKQLNMRQQMILLPLCALAYANTNTAGFDANGLFEVSAYGIGFIISQRELRFVIVNRIITVSIYLLVLYCCFYKIFITPYTWWGNWQSNIFDAKFEAAYPEMKNIFIDKNTKNAFDVVGSNIKHYSENNNDVYLFNLPLFYILEHKLLPGRMTVHWFDVVTDRQIQNEISFIAKNKPSVIVAYEPSDAAFIAHREMKHEERMGQEDMLNMFDNFVINGEYYFSQSVILKDVVNIKPEDQKIITVDVLVQQHKIFGKKFDEIFHAVNCERNVKIVSVLHQNGESVPDFSRSDGLISPGDILTIRGKRNDIYALAELLGVIRGGTRTLNSITIYVKKDRFIEKGQLFPANCRQTRLHQIQP